MGYVPGLVTAGVGSTFNLVGNIVGAVSGKRDREANILMQDKQIALSREQLQYDALKTQQQQKLILGAGALVAGVLIFRGIKNKKKKRK